jgi:hypothetical protein
MWRQSVNQVDRNLNQISAPASTLTIQMVETGDTGSTDDVASSSNESRHKNTPSNKTHISSLTIEYFSKLEVEKETEKEKHNNSAMLDSEDDIVDEEANDYDVLDEEVIIGLSRLTLFDG